MKHQPEEVARRFAQCYVGEVVMSSITYVVALNVTLVTNSEKDFARYPGLTTENWIEPPSH
ncbi:MAG: hypothetical protein NTU86_07440 [Burkholderiales bacterium]|nr:hypothetical protein [Burkholderiales bacterium]